MIYNYEDVKGRHVAIYVGIISGIIGSFWNQGINGKQNGNNSTWIELSK